MNETTYELVVCIINAGFSQNVMEAARAAGAASRQWRWPGGPATWGVCNPVNSGAPPDG